MDWQLLGIAFGIVFLSRDKFTNLSCGSCRVTSLIKRDCFILNLNMSVHVVDIQLNHPCVSNSKRPSDRCSSYVIVQCSPLLLN